MEHLLSELEAINGQIDLLLTAMDMMYSTSVTKEENDWTELDELF